MLSAEYVKYYVTLQLALICWKEHCPLFIYISDVTIHDCTVYRDTLGHGTMHDTLSLCIVSSRYIGKLSLMYENSHRIVKLSANTPNYLT